MQIIIYEQQIPRDILDGIQHVHQLVFEGEYLKEEKLQKPKLVAVVAIEDEMVVGFKLGYEIEQLVFFSWLGGVHPNYRKQGIAQMLMTTQHMHCQKNNYAKVRTHSRNVRKAMLIVNIKAGFDVIATCVDLKDRHKIILEKDL